MSDELKRAERELDVAREELVNIEHGTDSLPVEDRYIAALKERNAARREASVVPVDWPARFRKAADVAEEAGHEGAGRYLREFADMAAEDLPPDVVEAIGRELGGGS